MHHKRHSQDTARNWSGRVQGPVIIETCGQCHLFLITLCSITGQRVKHPRTGPIDEGCRLPVSNRT